MPMPINTIPPTISVPAPKRAPSPPPRRRPSQDISPVVTPMMMAGYHTKTSTKPRLRPTASASMLTAMDSSTIVQPRDGSAHRAPPSGPEPARSMRSPMNASKLKATQWSRAKM